MELAAELADGETELSMLLPRRSYGKAWRRILHDQTADRIVDIVSQLPHVNATIVPFHVAPGLVETPSCWRRCSSKRCPLAGTPSCSETELPSGAIQPGTEPIGRLHWRTRAKVAGRVKSIRVQTLADVPDP